MFLPEAVSSSLPEVKRLAQARISKLQSLGFHLKNLLAKRIRLELEIKMVQQTLKRKGKTNSKELRLALHYEGVGPIDTKAPELYTWLVETSPETIETLRLGDRAAREILDLLIEENLITQEEAQEIANYL